MHIKSNNHTSGNKRSLDVDNSTEAQSQIASTSTSTHTLGNYTLNQILQTTDTEITPEVRNLLKTLSERAVQSPASESTASSEHASKRQRLENRDIHSNTQSTAPSSNNNNRSSNTLEVHTQSQTASSKPINQFKDLPYDLTKAILQYLPSESIAKFGLSNHQNHETSTKVLEHRYPCYHSDKKNTLTFDINYYPTEASLDKLHEDLKSCLTRFETAITKLTFSSLTWLKDEHINTMLPAFKKIRRLTSLDLHECSQIKGAFLHEDRINNSQIFDVLQHLDLHGCTQLNLVEFQRAELVSFKTLNLIGVRFNGDSLSHLSKMVYLKQLSISSTDKEQEEYFNNYLEDYLIDYMNLEKLKIVLWSGTDLDRDTILKWNNENQGTRNHQGSRTLAEITFEYTDTADTPTNDVESDQ